MTLATSSRFQIKGINDEQDTCSCCGKSGLKRVVWIEDKETGDVDHFGTACAAQPAKCFGITTRDINKAVREYEKEAEQKKRDAAAARQQAAYEYAVANYTGGWIKKESPLVAGMFFTLCVDSADFDKLRAEYLASNK